jgi:hypothetical protein
LTAGPRFFGCPVAEHSSAKLSTMLEGVVEILPFDNGRVACNLHADVMERHRSMSSFANGQTELKKAVRHKPRQPIN